MRKITDRDRDTHIRTRARVRIAMVMVMVIVTGAAHTARAPRCLRPYQVLVGAGARHGQRGQAGRARGRRRANGGDGIASGRSRVGGRIPMPLSSSILGSGERTRQTRTRRSVVRARTMSSRRRGRKCALL